MVLGLKPSLNEIWGLVSEGIKRQGFLIAM